MTWLKKISFIVLLGGILLFSSGVLMAAPRWEPMHADISIAKSVSKEADKEILSMPSVILLNLHQQEKVEVFTILGRLVVEESLPPGSYQLNVEGHGIYIVKIGDLTCKVAL